MNIAIRTCSSVLVSVVALLAARPARAGESAPEPGPKAQAEVFGAAGQVVVSGAMQLNVTHVAFSTPSGSQPEPSATSFSVAPTMDVFVVRGLSIGARTLYFHDATVGQPALNGLTIGPHVGYNVPLGERFSFWPSVNAAYGETWYQAGGHAQGISIGAYTPVLYHPAAHLFLGLGPVFTSYLGATDSTPRGTTESPRLIEYGVVLTVGGWVAL